MATDLRSLAGQKTILLTTFRKDGSKSSSPVSLAFDGDRAFFRSWTTSWKSKRLRRNPDVEVAPATFRGTPTGPAMPARARLLSGADERLARETLARRHPILHRVLVPLMHRLAGYRTVHYELSPRSE